MLKPKIDINYVDSTKVPAEEISAIIGKKLEDKKTVLWLLSGGSAIDVAVLARKKLSDRTSLNNLHIGLIDERYGKYGHENSNWQQLIDSGFDFSNINEYPILSPNNLNVDETTSNYLSTLNNLLATVDFVIGLFGIGSDGHTAGLLPNCPISESSEKVDTYQAADFNRISITPIMFRNFDHIAVYIRGDAKKDAFEQLLHGTNSKNTPALYLKQANKLSVYTDIKGVAL